MAGRDAVHDAALDDLVGDLAAAPVGDRPPGVRGGLAGQRHDPADLLRGDPRRTPRPRGIGQAVGDAQSLAGHAGEGEPAITPDPSGRRRGGEQASDLGVVQAVGGGQDDPSP
ncbi:MAG: hypothetical protein JWN86_2514 [Planctomycetota bacterium]|nr:hypothetical protein [Planctomycetota bacterium]